MVKSFAVPGTQIFVLLISSAIGCRQHNFCTRLSHNLDQIHEDIHRFSRGRGDWLDAVSTRADASRIAEVNDARSNQPPARFLYAIHEVYPGTWATMRTHIAARVNLNEHGGHVLKLGGIDVPLFCFRNAPQAHGPPVCPIWTTNGRRLPHLSVALDAHPRREIRPSRRRRRISHAPTRIAARTLSRSRLGRRSRAMQRLLYILCGRC